MRTKIQRYSFRRAGFGRSFGFLAILAIWYGQATASALEIVQTFNQPITNTTWNVEVALNKYDSTLGTLTEVRIAMSTSWIGSADLTNNTAESDEFDITIRGRIALTKTQLAGSTISPNWLLVTADSADSGPITIANGATYTYTPSPNPWTNSGNTSYTAQADLDSFTGSGTLPTYMKALGSSFDLGTFALQRCRDDFRFGISHADLRLHPYTRAFELCPDGHGDIDDGVDVAETQATASRAGGPGLTACS